MSLSPDVILRGWLGSKHQPTNWLHEPLWPNLSVPFNSTVRKYKIMNCVPRFCFTEISSKCSFRLSPLTDALPCHIHLPVCLWIMDPHSRAPKKNTSHGNDVIPQDTTHLTQRPCYQRGSPCQDPAGNWATWRSPNDRKETQTAVVWSCFPLIRSGQNHLARHSERGKKTRRTKEEAGRQHQGMDRPWVRQVPKCSGEQGKMEKSGCKIICGAPTTLPVKGLTMMVIRGWK